MLVQQQEEPAEFIEGFGAGCEHTRRQIQFYLLTLPPEEAMVVIKLLGHITPRTMHDIACPH